MMLDADKIVVKDRIRKDFGDLEELAKDIKENGLINPPVVTPDNVLIAGERRFRAMTQILGWKQIEVRPMTVQDALHQLKLEISENENRKEFSFSEKMEWAERLKIEYGKIAEANKASSQFGADCPKSDTPEIGRVDDRVAKDVGLGGKSKLRQAEYIKANADEEMIRQLDEGQLSINAAFVTLKNKLKEVETERDNFAQEAVEACNAVKASTDSEEYMRMTEKVRKLEEQQRIDFEKQQLKDKDDRETRQKAAAERKAEIDKIKADAEAQVKLAQEQMEKANKALAEAPKEGKKSGKNEIIEVIPDDYEELKQAKAELDAIKNSSDPDISKQILRIHTNDRTPEQKLNNYEKRALDEVGGFLSILRGLEVQFDLCNKLSVATKKILRTNISEIQQILAKMDNAIMEGNEECKTA